MAEIVSAQPTKKRVRNFSEVALGFSKKQATAEAMRCPQPTDLSHAQRCPLGIDILGFIRCIREENLTDALLKIRENNPLAGICGRVCSAPCQKKIEGQEEWSIDIRALERFALDYGQKKSAKPGNMAQKEHAVAVVGSGPAGLMAAAELAKLGHGVTIFEALHLPGGILRYGIPEFRLPKKVLDAEIDYLVSLGVGFKMNSCVGQTYSIEELFHMGYTAVFLAAGACVPQTLGIPGENLKRVLTASEFLFRVNLMGAGMDSKSATMLPAANKIAVLGSGNDALDCARLGVRLGKKVTLIFEGTEDDMTKLKKEIEYAKEEGIIFELLTKPLEILADAHHGARGINCTKMDFADPDSSGQWRLIAVKGSEFILEADMVIVAAGYKPNPLIGRLTQNLKVKKDGTLQTGKDSFMTSLRGVFTGGDMFHGHGPLIAAMVSGKKAAQEIDRYLKKNR